MIDTVLLDLDDTVFDFKACERQALSNTLATFGISYTDSTLDLYSTINDSMWKLLEKGEITREELRIERFRLFLSEISAVADADVFATKYASALSDTDILISGAREFLQTLSENYALYAVTNGFVDTQMGRIRASGIEKYFIEIFISQKIGWNKPSPEFFDYCKMRIGFRKENTALIGDSLTSDIKGGKRYGLYTIWYNPLGLPQGDVDPDAEVKDYKDAIALLKAMK